MELDGAAYHTMSRSVARMPVFPEDDDRPNFLDRVGKLVECGDLVVQALCIMQYHYHLFGNRSVSRGTRSLQCSCRERPRKLQN